MKVMTLPYKIEFTSSPELSALPTILTNIETKEYDLPKESQLNFEEDGSYKVTTKE